MTSETTTTVVFSPFDEGDVILRSSDGVDFLAYRVVLGLASPFFKSMFSLRQPSDMETEDTTPVVHMAEDSVVVNHLLSYCYPIQNPIISDLAVLGAVLEAAIKYDMDEPVRMAKISFCELAKGRPLHAFAISCHLQLEEEAANAAELWNATRMTWENSQEEDFVRTLSGSSFVPEMDLIPAGSYYRLLESLRGNPPDKFCRPTSPPNSEDSEASKASPHGLPADRFTDAYPFNLPNADFVVRSRDGVDFKVHKLLLTLQADKDAALAERTLGEAQDDFAVDGLPAMTVQEDSNGIAEVLRLCYPARPGSASVIGDWTADAYCKAVGTMRVAQRYGLVSILDSYRTYFLQHVEAMSLDLYCIAVAFGWSAEASATAEEIARYGAETVGYTSLMESMPAKEYHRLLSYIHRVRSAMLRRMAKADYQGWDDVTQWKSVWYKDVDGKSTRWIHSILVEREVAAALRQRSPYQSVSGGSGVDLLKLTKEGKALDASVSRAIKKVRPSRGNSKYLAYHWFPDNALVFLQSSGFSLLDNLEVGRDSRLAAAS